MFFRIKKSPVASTGFFIGRETGALYVRTIKGNMVCIVGKGGVRQGEVISSDAGRFEPVLPGSIIEIEV